MVQVRHAPLGCFRKTESRRNFGEGEVRSGVSVDFLFSDFLPPPLSPASRITVATPLIFLTNPNTASFESSHTPWEDTQV